MENNTISYISFDDRIIDDPIAVSEDFTVSLLIASLVYPKRCFGKGSKIVKEKMTDYYKYQVYNSLAKLGKSNADIEKLCNQYETFINEEIIPGFSCQFTFLSGKRAGQKCGRQFKGVGSFCASHNKYQLDPENLETPVILTCPAIIRTGNNRGKACGIPLKIGHQFCGHHQNN
jgi:hypothetical protein